MNTNNENRTSSRNKWLLIICITAAGLIIGVWIWKSIQISNVRKKAVIEMQQLKDKVTNQILRSEELHLKSMAKPLVWAIRTEMLKNNIGQVNLYIIELVKEKSFQKVVVTDNKGLVLLSTNKKEEGSYFKTLGGVNFLLADTTVVEHIDTGLLIMGSPVMGFNNRLGTIIVTYSLRDLHLK